MNQEIISQHNRQQTEHQLLFDQLAANLSRKNYDVERLLERISQLQVAIPSWALGTGGTRFGRFSIGGEPGNLEEKIEDAALISHLCGHSSSISLHIPWDIPTNIDSILHQLASTGLSIDSVNSNTFQDQPEQPFSYKFGSLSHTDIRVREQAIQHNLQVVDYGKKLGSKTLTVWLSDGSNFPGQQHFRHAFRRTESSLQEIYNAMPADWTMLVEYKPYEPNFYSMVIPDWGSSKALCDAIGKRAKVLVDLGHHLPNTNIEQIVARLLHFGSLGGFHFNGSMYGDDDLTTGSIKPFQLFLIFHELIDISQMEDGMASGIDFMIDASHNLKDPLEDLLQSLQNITLSYARALIVNRNELHHAQESNDAVMAENVLQDAFQSDLRPLVAEARRRNGFAINPISCYREQQCRKTRINNRGTIKVSTGL